MRKNEHDEIMRILEINIQPENPFEPRGKWHVKVLWRAEVNGRWIGDGEIETIPLADAVERGVLSQNQYNEVFGILGGVADNYHKSEPLREEVIDGGDTITA